MILGRTVRPPDGRVAIARCADYGGEALYRALAEAAEAAGGLSGGAGFDVAGKTVLLKPNIVQDAPPERAVTTHPAFLEAAIRLVRERGAARVLVGDSPGLQGPGFQAKLSRLGETARANGAEWVDFTARTLKVSCPEGRVARNFTLAAVLEEADILITLPKLKTHQLMYFTGALKNQFGLIPSVQKSPYHVRYPVREDFAAMLVDLNLAAPAHFAFMDAVVGMEGPGPGSGWPRQIGAVLASANLLALDAAACALVGYPPAEIPVNAEALARGPWLKRFDDIEYPLLSPADLAVPDFVKIPIKRSGGRQLTEFLVPGYRKVKERFAPRPVADDAVCVRCGNCTRICASGAVTLREEAEGRRVVFDYQACIRCYCCHEICPVRAIRIEKTPLRTALFGKDSRGTP